MAKRSQYNDAVSLENLDKALQSIINDYSREQADVGKKCCKRAARKMKKYSIAEANKQDIKRRPQYISKIATKKTFESHDSIKYKWYVKSPDYRLTHLLEHGHAIWNAGGASLNRAAGVWHDGKPGGRSPAFPHIKPALDRMEKEYLEDLRRNLRRG